MIFVVRSLSFPHIPTGFQCGDRAGEEEDSIYPAAHLISILLEKVVYAYVISAEKALGTTAPNKKNIRQRGES